MLSLYFEIQYETEMLHRNLVFRDGMNGASTPNVICALHKIIESLSTGSLTHTHTHTIFARNWSMIYHLFCHLIIFNVIGFMFICFEHWFVIHLFLSGFMHVCAYNSYFNQSTISILKWQLISIIKYDISTTFRMWVCIFKSNCRNVNGCKVFYFDTDESISFVSFRFNSWRENKNKSKKHFFPYKNKMTTPISMARQKTSFFRTFRSAHKNCVIGIGLEKWYYSSSTTTTTTAIHRSTSKLVAKISCFFSVSRFACFGTTFAMRFIILSAFLTNI